MKLPNHPNQTLGQSQTQHSTDLSFGFLQHEIFPFALLDEIGIKVGYKVAKNLVYAYPERSEMGKLFSKIGSTANITGKVSGTGFYIYKKNKKYPNRQISEILKESEIEKNEKITSEEIIERCILRMINESALCLEEKIIDNPGYLDMSLILGIGFPPFRGGILRYADDMGIEKVYEKLEKYESIYGKRFTPCDLIISMHSSNSQFY